MAIKTTSVTLGPTDVKSLIIDPLRDQSVASQVSTWVTTTAATSLFPMATGGTTAAWVSELDDIPETTETFTETSVTPTKVAALTVVSSEAWDDDVIGVKDYIGRQLVAKLQEEIDNAYFSETPAAAGSPMTHVGPGLHPDVNELEGVAGTLDWAEDALAHSPVSNFAAHPDTIRDLALIKESTDSKRGLLQPNPAVPTGKLVAGVPLIPSNHISPGVIYGIPTDASQFVVRDTASLDVSELVNFTRDAVTLRAKMRVGWVLTNPSSISKIVLE